MVEQRRTYQEELDGPREPEGQSKEDHDAQMADVAHASGEGSELPESTPGCFRGKPKLSIRGLVPLDRILGPSGGSI